MCVGIDAGGSKTHVMIGGAKGAEVEFSLGSCYLPSLGPDGTQAALIELRDRILTYTDTTPLMCVMGLPGYGAARHWTAQMQGLCDHIFSGWPLTLLNDVKLAHASAYGLSPGILALAGTGSMVWALGRAGNEVYFGGWGYYFGDEGSGYDIGRLALRAASQGYDGRAETTMLSTALPQAMGVRDLWHVLPLLSEGNTRATIAGLVPYVEQVAEAGDKVAQGIITRAAQELSQQVLAACRTLDDTTLSITTSGGLFQIPRYVCAFTANIGVAGLAEPQPLQDTAAAGALRLARAYASVS